MQSTSRHQWWILLFCLVASAWLGCGDNPQKKGPKETAEAFLKALQFGDYDKAKTYCSEGTAQNLSMMESFAKLGANPMQEEFHIQSVEEDGNYATVKYDQGKETDKTLQLRKDDGKWVVVMSKTDFGTKDSNADTDVPDDDKEEEDEVPPAEKYKSYRDGKTAQEIAEAFMKALNYGDYDIAMRYGSKSTNDMLDYQKSMAELGNDKKKEAQKTVTRVEEDGEFAKAYYKEEGKKGEKVLKLAQDDNGNWEVIMTKSEMDGE